MMGGNGLNPLKAVENNPADVEGQAQVKAGKGLYNKLDGLLHGTIAMVLPDDGTSFLAGDPYYLTVTPGLHMMFQSVRPSVNYVGYPITMPNGMTIQGEIWADIPLKSAAFG